MPGELSQAGANLALDYVTGRAVPYTATRTTYLGLCSTAPTDTALGTELTTAGYARQAVTWTAPSGDPSSSNNSTQITFGPFTADPPNATHAELWAVSSGGVLADRLAWWALDVAKDAAVNESIQIAAAGCSLSID